MSRFLVRKTARILRQEKFRSYCRALTLQGAIPTLAAMTTAARSISTRSITGIIITGDGARVG